MPFGKPDISEYANYRVTAESSLSIPDSAVYISISMTPADQGWTQAGVDELFQQFLDHLAAAPFLALSGNASKSQAVATVVTPTPDPEP